MCFFYNFVDDSYLLLKVACGNNNLARDMGMGYVTISLFVTVTIVYIKLVFYACEVVDIGNHEFFSFFNFPFQCVANLKAVKNGTRDEGEQGRCLLGGHKRTQLQYRKRETVSAGSVHPTGE